MYNKAEYNKAHYNIMWFTPKNVAVCLRAPSMASIDCRDYKMMKCNYNLLAIAIVVHVLSLGYH